jgi:protein-disulfide isomerase
LNGLKMVSYVGMNMQQFAIPGAIIVAGALIAGSIVFTSPLQQNTNEPTRLAAADPTPTEISIDLDGYVGLGDPNAPVTIVEYSDFACPFCKRFAEETKPQIIAEYIDSGDVYFVRKDFIAVGGQRAAEAAHCAGEQGAFWEYVDTLYGNQAADRGSWNDVAVHAEYANTLGLDAAALTTCIEEGRYTNRVNQSSQEAVANGGSGTPFFIVNDTVIGGAQPFAVFQRTIEAELAN